MPTHRRLVLCLILTAALFLPATALAAGQPPEAERLGKQAEALADQGKYAEAAALAQKALALTEQALGPNDPATATALNDLAECLRNAGDTARAEQLHRRALAIREKVLGPNSADTAASLDNLGVVLDSKGDFAGAEPLHRRALAIREKVLGPDHPDVAANLSNLAVTLRGAGAPAKAEPLLRRALAITEKTRGLQHPEVAACLNNLGIVQYDLDQYAKSEASLSRALAIREKALGPEHPDTAMAMNNLALTLSSEGRRADAERLYRRALAAQEKTLGPNHADVASTLNNLGQIHAEAGEYAQAEPYFKRALAVMEKANGPEHPDTATVIDNYADMLRQAGRFAQAEPLYQRALRIRRKALGPEHPDTIGSLANVASLAADRGDYDSAEQLHRQVLALREKVLGPNVPQVAATLNELALLRRRKGDYAGAEALYKRSLAVWEKTLGPEDPGAATSLHNLGELYMVMGDYSRAEQYDLRALAIREKKLGEASRDTAYTLNNLGRVAREREQWDKAEAYYRRALAAKEKVLGPDHQSTGVTVNNLGDLYFARNDIARAEPYFKRGLAINEKVFGPDHPDTAVSLNNLATLYKQTGRHALAEPLYLRVLAIREKSLGPNHPDVAAILNNLAGLYAAMGQYDKTMAAAGRTQAITAGLLDQILGFTAEEQKLAFLASVRWEMDVYLSFIARHMSQRPDAVRAGYDVWLRRKGVVLESQRRAQEALAAAGGPEARAAMQELERVRAELSRLAFAPLGREDGAARQKRLDDLERRKGDVQATLSRLSRPFALDQKLRRADAAQVAAALPQGSVLVDIARIKSTLDNPKAVGAARFEERYIAFVLPAGRPEGLRLASLGRAAPIDAAVAAYKKAILENRADALAQQGRALYSLVFQPLAPLVGQAKRIFLSTDGALSLVPFETFRGPDGRFLIEERGFTYLAAARDVLGFGQSGGAPGRSLVLGDPDFDLDAAGRAKALAGLSLAQKVPAKAAARSADMAAMSFERLPATRQEAQAVQALLGAGQADLYTGAKAQEDLLAAARGPRILHLATHAFFLPIQELPAGADGQPAGPIRAENPLLRSGLVLAGANRALRGDAQAGGVVTAEKVMGFDLRATELVVLSACSTGEGEVQAGEGVYGLQRAFAQAGARGLVMSMWSVPDQETKELMEGFYRGMAAGQDRAAALRAAALRQLETARGRYGADNPLYWGAFVFLGDPGGR